MSSHEISEPFADWLKQTRARLAPAVPRLLDEVFALESAEGLPPVAGITLGGPEAYFEGLDLPSDAPDRLVPFASEGDGSQHVFWVGAAAEPAIARLGSDGEHTIIAIDLAGYLALLGTAYLEDPDCWSTEAEAEFRESLEEEELAKLEAFTARLRELDITPPLQAGAAVQSAQAACPDFQEWVEP